MGLLSKDAILNAKDAEYRDVEVPEWGGTVRVKALNGRERDEFERHTMETKNGKSNFRARLAAITCVDEDGHLLFTQKDIPHLGLRSAAALQRVFNVAAELSGMTAKDVEDMAEDFAEGPSDDESSITD